MSDPAVTTAWARAFVDELARSGVEHVCVAPGSRSTPLVMAIAGDGRFTTWVQIDERSAGFFALGIGKATGIPAAVVTTSGTATANLFPAVVEASQAGVPLLLLTADRPLRFRGSDANQTIDQEDLYGSYPRLSADAGDPSPEGLQDVRRLACRAVSCALGRDPGPVHVNLPFDKPLEPVEPSEESPPESAASGALGRNGRADGAPIDPPLDSQRELDADHVDTVADFLKGAERGLIVAGPVSDPERVGRALNRIAEVSGVPLLADPLSGARFCDPIGAATVSTADLFLRDPAAREYLRPERIVRVGGPPTSAGILSFLEECRGLPQLVVSSRPERKDSLADRSIHVTCDVACLLSTVAEGLPDPSTSGAWTDLWRSFDRGAAKAVSDSHGDLFEGDVLAAIVAAMPDGGTLFVSNSMPVRDLDAYGGAEPKDIRVLGNRGASGIDGIVSTAAGVAAAKSSTADTAGNGPVVLVLGDLALYHDMNGLLAVARRSIDLRIVLINNDGGGIFHMLPIREHEPEFTRYFATPHGLDFRHAAALYDIPYRLSAPGEAVDVALGEVLTGAGPRILEIRTDRVVNHRRHRQVVDAVSDAVRPLIEPSQRAG